MRSLKRVIDIEYVARLARIRLTEAEKERFTKDLAEILAYVEKLKELDTEKVEPTSHVIAIQNVFRGDEVLPSLPVGKVIASAPQKEENLFKIPKIL